MAPKSKSTPYDDDLQREIADFNARYALPMVTPDAAPAYDGSIPDDDPDWIAWQKRYPKTLSTDQK